MVKQYTNLDYNYFILDNYKIMVQFYPKDKELIEEFKKSSIYNFFEKNDEFGVPFEKEKITFEGYVSDYEPYQQKYFFHKDDLKWEFKNKKFSVYISYKKNCNEFEGIKNYFLSLNPTNEIVW